MADLVTRCPSCRTAFRVVQDQLRLRDGRVRCGVCHHVFDARAEEVAFDPRDVSAGIERQRVPAPTASTSVPVSGRGTSGTGAWRASPTAPPAAGAGGSARPATPRREPPSAWPYDEAPARTAASTRPVGSSTSTPRREPMSPWPYDEAPTRAASPAPRVPPAAPDARRAVPPESSARDAGERAEPVVAGAAWQRETTTRTEPGFSGTPSRAPQGRVEPELGRRARADAPVGRTEPALTAALETAPALPPFIARRPEATRSSLETRGAASARAVPGFTPRPTRADPVSSPREEPVVSRPIRADDAPDERSVEPREPGFKAASRDVDEPVIGDAADAEDRLDEDRREPVMASASVAKARDAEPDDTDDADTVETAPEPAFAAGPGDGWHTAGVATRRRREVGLGRRLLLGGCVLALIGLLFQAAWWWRTPLATYAPGTRPALETMCRWFGCTVDYVRAPRLLSIESSSVQPDTTQPGGDLVQRLTLTAVLRNRAAHDQPWPSLELSLTDFSDTVIMRRVVPPEGYLGPAAANGAFAAGSEQRIAVGVSARGAPITGYRLALFFP